MGEEVKGKDRDCRRSHHRTAARESVRKEPKVYRNKSTGGVASALAQRAHQGAPPNPSQITTSFKNWNLVSLSLRLASRATSSNGMAARRREFSVDSATAEE